MFKHIIMAEIYDELRMKNRPLTNNGKENSDICIDVDGSKAIELTNGHLNLYVSNLDEVCIMQRGGCGVYQVKINNLYEFELLRRILNV